MEQEILCELMWLLQVLIDKHTIYSWQGPYEGQNNKINDVALRIV